MKWWPFTVLLALSGCRGLEGPETCGFGSSCLRALEAAALSTEDVTQIAITLSGEAWSALEADEDTYVEAEVQVTSAGLTARFPRAGLRLKGNASRRPLGQKAAFLIRFDKFVPNQRLGGLRKVALNNMVQDPSALNEVLGYALFRGQGLPASRAAHSEVTLNGEPYGLYALVEATDNPSTHDRWFGPGEALVYEGEYGADLNGSTFGFELQRGSDFHFEAIQALATTLGEISDDDFWDRASEHIDLPAFARFIATETWLSQWDGYGFNANNYFLVRRPDAKWVWVPWGLDLLFADDRSPFQVPYGVVLQRCVQNGTCRSAVRHALWEVDGRARELDLIGEAQRLRRSIAEPLELETHREASLDEVLERQRLLLDRLHARGGLVAAWLGCPLASTEADALLATECSAD